jgi:hypothetical protein
MVYGDQVNQPAHTIAPCKMDGFMNRKHFYVIFAVQYLTTLISYVLLVLTDYILSSLQVFYLLTYTYVTTTSIPYLLTCF